MHDQLERLGGPVFDADDRRFAWEIQATLSSEAAINDSYARFGLEPVDGETLREGIYPLGSGNDFSIGSTDVGTVSWIAPNVQCRVGCYAVGTPGHSWQLVAQGKASAAHKGLVFAAKAMAATATDLFANGDKLASAKAHHRAFRERNKFRIAMQDVRTAAAPRKAPNS